MMKKKSILFQAKAKLAKMLKLSFESVLTNDGLELYIDGDIVAGAAIYQLTDAGEYIPAADGTYTAGEQIIEVLDGTITGVNTDEDYEGDDTPASAGQVSGESVTPEAHNELVEIVNQILDVVKEQEAEIAGLQDEVMSLSTELSKATGSTKGKPAGKDKFNRSSKQINFADQKMKKLIENFK